MADEADRDVGIFIVFLFKLEDDCHVIDKSADLVYPFWTPGPYLGADVKQHLDTQLPRMRRHLQVEFRIIHQYQQVRAGFIKTLLDDGHRFFDVVPVVQDFDQADYCDDRRIEKDLDPGFPHRLTTHAAKLYIGLYKLELLGEFGGVRIAGGLTGQDHDVRLRHQAPSMASHTDATCCSVISGNTGNERQRLAVLSVIGSSGCTVSAYTFC